MVHCIDIMRTIKIEKLFLINVNKKYSEENETSARFYIILNSKINKCSLTVTVTETETLTITTTLKITIAVLTALLVN